MQARSVPISEIKANNYNLSPETYLKRACDYCEKSHIAKGMCRFHYDRARRGVDFAQPVQELHAPYGNTPCAEPGCPDLAKLKGYCRPHASHYRQAARTRARKVAGPRRHCLDCSQDITFENGRRKRCPPCVDRWHTKVAIAAMAQLHHKRKEAGLCVTCGREPRYGHRVRCRDCTIVLNQYRRPNKQLNQ